MDLLREKIGRGSYMWCKQKRPTKTMTHQMQMKSNHKRIVNPFTFSCEPNSLDLNSFESFPCDDIWIFLWRHLSQRRWCNHVDVLMFFMTRFSKTQWRTMAIVCIWKTSIISSNRQNHWQKKKNFNSAFWIHSQTIPRN